MAEKIGISFKSTTVEMQLYTEILAKEDRGNWIKAILKREIDKEKKQGNKKK